MDTVKEDVSHQNSTQKKETIDRETTTLEEQVPPVVDELKWKINIEPCMNISITSPELQGAMKGRNYKNRQMYLKNFVTWIT